jgi:hypothetical protein
MKPQRYGTSGMHREDGIFVLYGEYERVVAECERLRADAERYCWLRDKANFTKGLAPMVFNCEAGERIVWDSALTDEWLDDAIDAARAKEKA